MKTNILKYIAAATSAILLASCAETMEEKAKREADEFTEKNCPVPISRELTIDSLTFNVDSKTFTYYQSISPKYNIEDLNADLTRQALLSNLKNDPAKMKYKEAGYAFRYVYYPLTDPSNTVIDVMFTRDDYR